MYLPIEGIWFIFPNLLDVVMLFTLVWINLSSIVGGKYLIDEFYKLNNAHSHLKLNIGAKQAYVDKSS